MKNITLVSASTIISLILLSGCAHTITPSINTKIGTEKVFDKNYIVGKIQTAYVGEAIVKVKDYTINKYSTQYMKASNDFNITWGNQHVKGNSIKSYPVIGTSEHDNVLYTVVRAGLLNLYIDSNGTPLKKAFIGPPGMPKIPFTSKITPSNLFFAPITEEVIDNKAGFINYELIYSGTNGKEITISYREYTNKDMARPAFYQNLIYNAEIKKIRFKNTIIKIHEANNEKIVYTIVSDGISQKQ